MIMLPKIDPTTTVSWQRLQQHFEQIKDMPDENLVRPGA